jgi:hypothetical protein
MHVPDADQDWAMAGAEDDREMARKCRRLAANMSDVRTARILRELAAEYEARAEAAEPRPEQGPGPSPQ